MSTIADTVLAELSDQALSDLAERLRPYLDTTQTDTLLKPAQAAARLGVHPKTLTRAAAAGRVPNAERVGRSWRFRQTDLRITNDTPIVSQPPLARARSRQRRSTTADAIRTPTARRQP